MSGRARWWRGAGGLRDSSRASVRQLFGHRRRRDLRHRGRPRFAAAQSLSWHRAPQRCGGAWQSRACAESALKNPTTPRTQPPTRAITSNTASNSMARRAPVSTRTASVRQLTNLTLCRAALYGILRGPSHPARERAEPALGLDLRVLRRRRRNRPPETLRQQDRGGIRDLWKAGRRATRLPHRRGKGRRSQAP